MQGAYRFVVARQAAGSEVPRQNYWQETYLSYLLLRTYYYAVPTLCYQLSKVGTTYVVPYVHSLC